MSQAGRPAGGPLLATAAALGIALSFAARAHDVPRDVTVSAFLKPEGQRLRLLVRAPLGAMRDVEFPSRGPGYLDLARAAPSLRTAASLWIADAVELYEEEARLSSPRLAAVLVSLPSDRSFVTYEEALAHVTGPPLPDDTELPLRQGLLDVLLEYEIRSETSRFSLRHGLGRLGERVTTVVRFLPPGGAVRAFELTGDPGLVRLDPRWHQAALRFVALGFRHILEGTDHLLFLLCLVAPFRRLRALVLIVTSFTVAHSLTLIASAFRFGPEALWFPALVETAIALSIVYMALENIVVARPRRRWVLTFAFGLVHGFGFAFGLRETLQFAGSHLLASLLSFNLGVELGQLLVLLVLLPALHVLQRLVAAERVATILMSALVAHTAWHWLLERFALLRQFRFQWPALDAALLAALAFWLMLAAVALGLAWLVSTLLLRSSARQSGTLLRGRSHDA